MSLPLTDAINEISKILVKKLYCEVTGAGKTETTRKEASGGGIKLIEIDCPSSEARMTDVLSLLALGNGAAGWSGAVLDGI